MAGFLLQGVEGDPDAAVAVSDSPFAWASVPYA